MPNFRLNLPRYTDSVFGLDYVRALRGYLEVLHFLRSTA